MNLYDRITRISYHEVGHQFVASHFGIFGETYVDPKGQHGYFRSYYYVAGVSKDICPFISVAGKIAEYLLDDFDDDPLWSHSRLSRDIAIGDVSTADLAGMGGGAPSIDVVSEVIRILQYKWNAVTREAKWLRSIAMQQ